MKKITRFFLASLLILGATTRLIAEESSEGNSSIQPSSLLHNAWKIYSQNGEEGILDAILSRLDIKKGFFVEFGACDAVALSNTRFLAEKRGWAGAFIESSKKYAKIGKKNCKKLKSVSFIKKFVCWDKSDKQGMTLDKIAHKYFPNKEIDVLSIDIDGPDYLILKSLKQKPKIIIIEGGAYWHPKVTTKIPDTIAANELNQPLSIIFEIANKQGYLPVCYTINTFLVRKDLYKPFVDIKNDPETLWMDSWNYFKITKPEHIAYITKERSQNPLIRKYDKFPTPK